MLTAYRRGYLAFLIIKNCIFIFFKKQSTFLEHFIGLFYFYAIIISLPAQSIEQRIRNPQVGSLILPIGSIKKRAMHLHRLSKYYVKEISDLSHTCPRFFFITNARKSNLFRRIPTNSSASISFFSFSNPITVPHRTRNSLKYNYIHCISQDFRNFLFFLFYN